MGPTGADERAERKWRGLPGKMTTGKTPLLCDNQRRFNDLSMTSSWRRDLRSRNRKAKGEVMTAMNGFARIAHRFHHLINTFGAAVLASVLTLLVAAANSRAANPTWTNAASDVWQSTTAWDTAPAFPVTGDTVNFTNVGVYTVTLANDVPGISSIFVNGTNGTQTLTLNLDTNTVTVVGASTSPGPFYVGSQGVGATGIVYLSSSKGCSSPTAAITRGLLLARELWANCLLRMGMSRRTFYSWGVRPPDPASSCLAVLIRFGATAALLKWVTLPPAMAVRW